MVTSLYPEFERKSLEAGKVVRLADGRIGTIDTVKASPCAGETGSRAYVIGLGAEFAAWVTESQVDKVYGEAVRHG